MLRSLVASLGLLLIAGCGRIEIVMPEQPLPAASENRPAENPLLAQAAPSVPAQAPATMRPPVAIGGASAPVVVVAVPASPGNAMTQPAISQWTERDVAIDALGRIGPAAVPALSEALANRDAKVRREAARALSYIGPEAKEAVNSLILATKDEDAGVRFLAIRALGQIGPGAKDAVPILIRAMQ